MPYRMTTIKEVKRCSVGFVGVAILLVVVEIMTQVVVQFNLKKCGCSS
jgi:hypothetical protein